MYTLPVAMPPSINDVGPIINLTYVSGQQNGIAGQGWSINSISNITRIATRVSIDGFKDGVDFDENDKLALDGQRLLLKSGIYWQDGSVYETEVHSNTKIELKGTGTSIYFIVTSPDGSRTWYGNYNGINGTDTNAYYAVRFEDANANFMDYVYARPFNKGLCITEIKFSGNTITNPTSLNKILFTYEASARKENGYVGGNKIEKAEILKKIQVFTNNLLFKEYRLTHITDAQGYQRVTQLQEINGASESANTVDFTYNVTPDGATEFTTAYTDSLSLTKSPDLSGDFDGDGRVDFVASNKIFAKLFQGGGTTYDFPAGSTYVDKRLQFAATTINNNKINQYQSIVKTKEGLSSITFNIFDLKNSTIQNSYSKTIPIDNSAPCSDECTVLYDEYGDPIPGVSSKCSNPTYIKNSNEYIEGDFNGDSISEVLILSYDESKTYKADPAPPIANSSKTINPVQNIADPNGGSCYWHWEVSTYIKEARIIDLNPSSPTAENSIGNIILNPATIQLLQTGKRYVMDFNSDGKSDILLVESNKNYKILSFKQLTAAPWVEMEIIGQGLLADYATNKPLLFGDYNGDGKTDIMLPVADGKCQPFLGSTCPNGTLWSIYYGNPKPSGGEFFTKESYTITDYINKEIDGYPINIYNYYAMDINKDGKSDLVKVWTSLWQYDSFFDPKDIDSSWKVSSYINNIGLNEGFINNYNSPSNHNSDNNSLPIPLVSNYKYQGMDSDLLMVRYHGQDSFSKTVTYLDFTKDFNEDNALIKVTQSGGAIVDEISYQAMEADTGTNDLGTSDGFYSSTESLQYPFIEIKKIPTNKLVLKVKNTSLGVTKQQLFKYHGYTADLSGVGVVGFKKTARSSWHRNSSDKVTWSVTENNPLLRGASVKTYSQLLSGSDTFSFDNSSFNVINQEENTYTESIDPITKRYAILLNKKTNKNNLTNVVTETINDSYSADYFLPTSITTKNYEGTSLQGTSTTITDYDNAVSGIGSAYYIGKPKQTTTTVTAYGNTQISTEKYFYSGSNISRTEKNANGALETIVESFDYFSNGLLKTKTISATGTTSANSVAPRSTSYTYDTTNRFVKTITDAEGLVTTNNSYHNLYGLVLSQTNPLGQMTTNTYDNWGKKTKVTDFLGKSINYTYARSGGIYTTTETGDDGSATMTESDALARVIRKGVKDLNGNWNYVVTEYDYQGKKTRESEPYDASSSASLWTTYEYDDYSRPVKTILPTGKIGTTTYNGLTVTVNDEIMTKSKTVNANGHVISSTDTPGGTILFKYNAAGNLIESNYDGVRITTNYDAWGRRISLTDSSAGTYTTEYNAFGETLKETSPKGITTYTLNAVGKPLTKRVEGNTPAEKTDILSTYTYDGTYKWLSRIDVTNPNDGNSSYAYAYDSATKQLNQTIETLPYATFTKNLTFDAFGRVDTEATVGVAHGKTSAKTIKHTYKNGAKWQMLDGTTVIWQANTVNARGQLTGATLGNGINVANTYNSFGMPTQMKHDKTGTTTVNVMTLNNTFNVKTGNLTSRYSSLFDVNENFGYDSLDRLVQWPATPTQFAAYYFNSGVEGFTAFGAGATVTNYQGKLKTVATNYFAGTQKQLLTNGVVGQAIKIKGNYTKVTGASPVLAIVTETNPTTNEGYETIIQGMATGTFEFNYTIQYYSNISIRFAIDGDTSGIEKMGVAKKIGKKNLPQPSIIGDGSGGPTVSATFYLDNIVLSKYSNGELDSQSYDDRGRITANKLGTYNYLNNNKPYQQTSVDPLNNDESAYYQSRGNLNITYNAFKAPVQIEEIGKDKLSFAYNALQQRSAMYYGSTDDDKMLRPNRRYYSADGSMEVNYNKNTGAVEFITFIGGDSYSAPAVIKSDGTTQNYFYLHRDYQGTIVAITNALGSIVEKRHFDAWGGIIKIQDGVGNDLAKLTFFDRGYTGHEHMQSVGLINMNARLYDPKLHRFLQPDNYVQDPYNTQNYNRYGYCVNNPLKYTDISGNVFGLDDAIIVGIGIGLASYFTMAILSDQPITLTGALKAAIIGGISGAVTFGIGEWTQGIANFFSKAGVQALAHGTFQGLSSGIQGGGFWTGMASGALSSIASSAWNGGSTFVKSGNITEEFVHRGLSGALDLQNGFGTILFGTITGGAAAELTGGNFWKGALVGLVVSSLNHEAHGGKTEKKEYTYRKYDDSQNSEKIVYFHKGRYKDAFGKSHNDKLLYNQAVSEPLVENTLSLYGHGNTHFFNGFHNESDVDALLIKDSIMYRNFVKNGGGLVINLKSCYTGDISDGYTMGEALSYYRIGLTIHAPASEWLYTGEVLGNKGYNQFIGGEKTGWDLKR